MAFPTTSLLDAFTGVDNTTLPSHDANWTTPSGSSGLKLSSNQATSNTGAGKPAINFWSSGIGPDCEVYYTVSVLPGSGGWLEFGVRFQDIGNKNTRDGYVLDLNIAASNNASITRVTNDVFTTLGSAWTQTVGAGDIFGLEIIGSTIKAYRKPSGGSWAQIGSTQTDSTYTAAGSLMIEIPNSDLSGGSGSIDDFSGGTISGGTTYENVMSVMKKPALTTISVLTSDPVLFLRNSKSIRTIVNQTIESTMSLMNKKAITAIINSTINSVINLGLVKNITIVGSNAFEARTDFGISKSLTTIPVSTISGVFGLQSSKGLTDTVTAIYETTLYLPLSLGFTETGELTIDGVIALPVIKGESVTSAFTFNSSLALHSAKSISDNASLTVDQTIALSRISNISMTVLATLETTTAMQRSLAVSMVAANSLLATLGLQRQLSIVSLSGLLSEGSISLGRTLAVTVAPSLTVDQTITLSKQVSLSNAVNEILFTALALARTLSVGIVGANTLDAAVSFLRSVAIRVLQDVGTQTFENVLSLARSLAVSTSTLATLNVNTVLQKQDSITLDAVASLFSALSLSKTVSISTLSGLLISLVLSTLGKINRVTDSANLTVETSIGLNKSQSMEDSNIGTLINQLSMGKTVSISSIATAQIETVASVGRVLSITINSGFAFDETLSLQILQSLTTISDLIQFLGNLPAKLIIGDQTLWLVQANDKVVPSDIIDIDGNQSDLHIEDTDNV